MPIPDDQCAYPDSPALPYLEIEVKIEAGDLSKAVRIREPQGCNLSGIVRESLEDQEARMIVTAERALERPSIDFEPQAPAEPMSLDAALARREGAETEPVEPSGERVLGSGPGAPARRKFIGQKPEDPS